MNRRPLRPELAAPLGVCPPSQLTQGVGGSTCSLLLGALLYLLLYRLAVRLVLGAAPRRGELLRGQIGRASCRERVSVVV